MRRFGRYRSAATLAALSVTAAAIADKAPTSQSTTAGAGIPVVPRTDGAIRVDGVLDEPFWVDALTFELNIETNPRENEPAPVRTTARISGHYVSSETIEAS